MIGSIAARLRHKMRFFCRCHPLSRFNGGPGNNTSISTCCRAPRKLRSNTAHSIRVAFVAYGVQRPMRILGFWNRVYAHHDFQRPPSPDGLMLIPPRPCGRTHRAYDLCLYSHNKYRVRANGIFYPYRFSFVTIPVPTAQSARLPAVMSVRVMCFAIHTIMPRRSCANA